MEDGTPKTPGQLISDLLAERGWSQRLFAAVLGVDETRINRFVTDRQPINAKTALVFEEMFDVPADRFLTLQKQYDLAKAKIEARPNPARATRAHLIGGLPIREMTRRGWIAADDIRDVVTVERELTRFFGAATANEIEILPHAAKKTVVNTEPTPAQLAWIYRVRQIASEMLVPRYAERSARSLPNELQDLLLATEEARRVPRLLEECGIRFVVVESLRGTKIDGVCFWLDEFSPVIGMTLRFDRIDSFWFVLRHELEHVLRGHGQTKVMLDTELEGERAGTGTQIEEEERVANEAAADFCVPRATMRAFLVRKAPFFAERDMLGLARTIRVHPGLVAGQLANATGRFDRFRKHLAKIRHIVTPTAAVDGWGDVYPTED